MERTPSQRKHIGVTQTECDKKKKQSGKPAASNQHLVSIYFNLQLTII